jgi:hypothetical protein
MPAYATNSNAHDRCRRGEPAQRADATHELIAEPRRLLVDERAT